MRTHEDHQTQMRQSVGCAERHNHDREPTATTVSAERKKVWVQFVGDRQYSVMGAVLGGQTLRGCAATGSGSGSAAYAKHSATISRGSCAVSCSAGRATAPMCGG